MTVKFPKKVIALNTSKAITIPFYKADEEGIEVGDIVDVSITKIKKYND